MELPPTSHDLASLAGGQLSLRRYAFADLAGWADDDHAAAYLAFLRTCGSAPALRAGLPPPPALERVCRAALEAGALPAPQARAFLERHFEPYAIEPGGEPAARGFLTGYFEPEYPAALQRDAAYPTPLYGRPPDLVTLGRDEALTGGPDGLQAARRLADGRLVPYPTRREIEESEPDRWPVLAWLRDPVDRFVMQVQGSARLRLVDGGVRRIAYAGRNGHPYVSLGRLLSRAEAIPPAEMTMDRLVARLKADPAWTRSFLWNNPSFVFFRIADELGPDDGPIGGAGVPLTRHRSVAADRALWPYGLPLWLDGEIPTAERGRAEALRRLTVIQDTGSAIVGPARFDLFYGSGDAAGFVAGLTRHPVAATILWPRAE